MPAVTFRHRSQGPAPAPARRLVRSGILFGVLVLLGAVFPRASAAQATGSLRRLPAPVRQAGHTENLPPAPPAVSPWTPTTDSRDLADHDPIDRHPNANIPGANVPGTNVSGTNAAEPGNLADPMTPHADGWAPNGERLDWSYRTAPPEPRVTILRSPTMAPPAHLRGHGHGNSTGSAAARSAAASGHPRVSHHANRSVDPPRHPVVDGYHGIHQRMMKPHPNIPGASEPTRTWKQPYSYGYFGASGKRHWGVHHGYRDRTTEWRYR